MKGTRRHGKVLLLALLLVLASCASPEDGRQRGAGLGTGADPRNYPSSGPAPGSKVFETGSDQDQNRP